MLKETLEVLQLDGCGDSEEQALQALFQKIRPALDTRNTELFLQIEPQAIEIVDAVQRTYTERFLGILFPRRRKKYEITAKITVRIRSFSKQEIVYRQEEEKLSMAKHILEMR